MASFREFLKSFDTDRGKRGHQFERFVKWFLKNDPEWATQVDEVWLWNDYPGQWGRDCGVDLVFKDKLGGVWAVQAKCYSPSYEITKSDVDKFLSESNRKEINHRLLIATTDRIGANARQVLDGQEKSVVGQCGPTGHHPGLVPQAGCPQIRWLEGPSRSGQTPGRQGP
jgi:predicted helicase